MGSHKYRHEYDLEQLHAVTPPKRRFEMLVSPRYVSRYRDGPYEDFTADLLQNFVQGSVLFVDIGAHYGYYTLLAATQQGSRSIIAFEPVPENYEVLRRNVERNKVRNTELHKLALSDASEKRELIVAEASDSCGFYEHPLSKSIDRIPVDAVALDDFLENIPKGPITLKVDVEGHELAVLEGMKRTLGEADDVRLFLECNPKCLAQAGHQPEALLRTIDRLGLDAYLVDDQQRLTYKLGADDQIDWDAAVADRGYANLLCRSKKQSLSVCFFSHSSWLAGAERSLLELVTELIRDYGAICSVVVPGAGPLAERLREAGAAIVTAEYAWWCAWPGCEDGSLEPRLTGSLQALLEKMPELGRANPDVVVTNTMVIPWGAVVASLLGKPHVWFIREFGELDYDFKFHLPFQTVMRFIRDSSNLVFVASNAVRAQLFGAGSDENVFTIAHHIEILDSELSEDTGEYFSRAGATRLIITGSGIESKGQEDAVLAVKELVRRGRDVELLLVGGSSGPYLEQLADVVRQENLRGYIKFIDFQDNVYPIVSQTDIVLVCSRCEAFGRVTLEAMLLKKPVIGTDAGGTRELIEDGFNGLLYQPGDYRQLADRIQYLMEHKEKIQEFGRNGYEFARRHHTKEKHAGRAYELLKDLRGAANPVRSPFFHLVTGLLQNLTSSSSEEARELQRRLADREQEVHTLGARLAENDQEIAGLIARAAESEQEVRSLGTQMAQKEQQMECLITQVANNRQEAKALSRQIAQGQQRIESLIAQAADSEQEVQSLSAQVGHRDETIGKLRAQLAENTRSTEALEAAVEETLQRIRVVAAERDSLGGELSAIHRSKTWRIAKKGLRVYQLAQASWQRLVAGAKGRAEP